MAKAEDGRLIDPFGGAEDLQARVLRHVSPAFTEDPLRVLRVARFAARFAHLGFTVAADTVALMRNITASGELAHLAAERVWAELEGGLSARTPSKFLKVLRDCGALAVLLPEVDALFDRTTPQHAGEVLAFKTQVALDYAAERDWPAEVRFAVLLHEVGDGDFHELPVVQAVCERLRAPNAFMELALAVFALHQRCHAALQLSPSELLTLLEAADLLRRPERFDAFVQACGAIHASRVSGSSPSGFPAFPQAELLRRALAAASEVKAAALDLRGLKGDQIGKAMREARIAAIAALAA
jgi:tRNA nucleotidyltransferase (CCA-adding enzyme)